MRIAAQLNIRVTGMLDFARQFASCFFLFVVNQGTELTFLPRETKPTLSFRTYYVHNKTLPPPPCFILLRILVAECRNVCQRIAPSTGGITLADVYFFKITIIIIIIFILYFSAQSHSNLMSAILLDFFCK